MKNLIKDVLLGTLSTISVYACAFLASFILYFLAERIGYITLGVGLALILLGLGIRNDYLLKNK